MTANANALYLPQAVRSESYKFICSQIKRLQNVAQEKKDSKKKRFFCLPGTDEQTLTEMLLITQYRFFRG